MNTEAVRDCLLRMQQSATEPGTPEQIRGSIKAALALIPEQRVPADPMDAWKLSFQAQCRRIARMATKGASSNEINSHIANAREILLLGDRVEAKRKASA